jgi:hypothetical protein
MLSANNLVDEPCRHFLASQFSGCVVLEVLFASVNCDMAYEPQTSVTEDFVCFVHVETTQLVIRMGLLHD